MATLYKYIEFLRYLCGVVCLTCLVYGTSAQDYLGYTSSNYAGVSKIHLQPASIADSRYRFDFNLFGMDVGFGNNYLGFRRETTDWLGDHLSNFLGDVTDTIGFFQESYLTNFPRSNDLKHLHFYLNAYLPSFMVSINNRHSIALTWSLRNYFNINGVDPKLAKLAWEGFDYPPLWDFQFERDRFNIQTMSWAEYGLTYGGVMYDSYDHFVKGGLRVKYLQGINAAYFFGRDLNYLFFSEDSLHIEKTRFRYGHSDNFYVDQGQIRYQNSAEPSFGFDLGVVYEYRPDYKEFMRKTGDEPEDWAYNNNENKYKVKAGLSLTDFGWITYKTGIYSKDFKVRKRNVVFSTVDDSVPSLHPDSIADFLFKFYDVAPKFKMSLPTALNLQVDYNIWKDFYINFNGTWGFKSNKNLGVKQISRMTLTPRWDHKWLGAFAPIAFNEYKQLKPGLALRLGPVVVGSNDLGTFFNQTLKGANAFFALKVPIPHGKPKEPKEPVKELIADTDKDGIRDPSDSCRFTPGLAIYHGCPDTDKDSIIDKEDDCPETAGLAKFQGCPDRDLDGIMDKEDECPDSAGIAKFNGCPDSDKDGLMDKEDDCPHTPGPIETQGCPDRDEDGILDNEDACPDKPGPQAHQGCPDTDGDGLYDHEDECVDTPGPKENDGCPYGDRDNDGINDKEDDCPTTAGLEKYNGCPDRDSDGIIDKEDDCPDEPGSAEHQGCPDSDKDGIIDKKDKCPDTKGLVKFNGCPDRDLDGFIDSEDECPDEAGSIRFQGCPDSDEDSIPDKDDECPETPGTIANNGCPELEEEQQAIIDTAFARLEFESGRAVIKEESYAPLDSLGKLLKDNPDWKLRIAGHTDNLGPADANMRLSKARANAVKQYLVRKDIDPERFKVEYYGEKKPVADNSTPGGRAKNRRVELELIFE